MNALIESSQLWCPGVRSGDDALRGCIGCWPLSEGSGNRANNAAGRTPGIFSADAAWTVTDRGMCPAFTAVGHHVHFGSGWDGFVAGDFTVLLSAYFRSMATGAKNLIGGQNDYTTTFLLSPSSASSFGVYVLSDSALFTVSGIGTENWWRIVLVRDGSDIRLYANGELAGSGTVGANTPGASAVLRVGSSFATAVDFLSRDVRFFNRAMPAHEIAWDYEHGERIYWRRRLFPALGIEASSTNPVSPALFVRQHRIIGGGVI